MVRRLARRLRRTGSDVGRLGSAQRGPLLQVPHKEIWLRGADAIHDVSHKPTTGGDPFADLGDEHFEPFAPQSAGGVLVTRGSGGVIVR